jgi:transcriptional regulator with XRE-family HTH domain
MNLCHLVKTAQGKTPDNEFARKIGVPITYLNELKKGLVINDPTPQVLKRISEFNEEVSYINLLIAAGYLNEKDIGGLVEKYTRYVFGKSDYGVVSLENGFFINGVEIENLIDVSIKSDISNVSEVTVKFYAKIKGLDFKTIL